MAFKIIAPRAEKQQPQTTVYPSPGLSQYGHSPSIPPPAYTTDDLLAAKYDKIARWTQFARTVLTLITLCLSVVVIGCSADALREYSTSQSQSEWLLPLWPMTMDLRPTRAVLACGIIMTVFSLGYLVLVFVPMRKKLHKLNTASTTLAFLSLFLTLFTTIFASTITSNFSASSNAGSLLSWTCKWQGHEELSPASFTKVCNEGSVALDMVVALIVLSVLNVLASAGGWWAEMMLKRGGLDGETKSQVELVHQV